MQDNGASFQVNGFSDYTGTDGDEGRHTSKYAIFWAIGLTHNLKCDTNTSGAS